MTAAAQVATQEQLQHIIAKHLRSLAPEADVDALRPHDDICETLEVDALDFHNFLLALKAETGIDAPAQRYSEINTIEKLSTYLHSHAGPHKP